MEKMREQLVNDLRELEDRFRNEEQWYTARKLCEAQAALESDYEAMEEYAREIKNLHDGIIEIHDECLKLRNGRYS